MGPMAEMGIDGHAGAKARPAPAPDPSSAPAVTPAVAQPAIPSASPVSMQSPSPALPPILLDVTRLVSRIGRGHPTGIDRVEAAWLGHLLGRRGDHLLCRTRLGQLVLPAAAGGAILRALGMAADGRTESGRPATGQGSRYRAGWRRGRVEAGLMRAAKARAGRDGRGLGAALDRAGLASDTVYLNVGHANLGADLLAAMPLPCAVLVHDAIPIDHPQWTRAGQDRAFRTRLQAVFDHAGLVLTVSQASAARLALWRDRLNPGRAVPIAAAHIGTGLAAADPACPRPVGGFFLTIGTIEPRKNHALLLDAWGLMTDPPGLVIAGRRGWADAAMLARLDAMAADGPIHEAATLSDSSLAGLMQTAHALLFPSRAEGFGLPLTEAAARGVPILALPLPSTREILGDYPCYLPDDPMIWAQRIADLARAPPRRQPPLPVPDWPGHFRLVAAALRRCRQEGPAG